jgi:excisionase family DNA binding protein
VDAGVALVSNTSNDQAGLLNLDEAATFLRISKSKLYLLMSAGDLAFVKLGRSRRVSMFALKNLIERNTVNAGTENKSRARRAR